MTSRDADEVNRYVVLALAEATMALSSPPADVEHARERIEAALAMLNHAHQPEKTS